MKRCKLWQALVALVVLGGAGSPALLAQEVQLPEGISGIPTPGGAQTAPLPGGLEGIPGEDALGDAQMSDAINTGGWPFIFNVPVSLSDLHENVDRVTLECWVYGNAATGETAALKGVAEIPFDKTSRSFEDVINVRVSEYGEIALNPLNATSYYCRLALHTQTGTVGWPQCVPPVILGESFHLAAASPDDCYQADPYYLLTGQLSGEIDPRARTATACRYGFGNGDFIDCQ